MPTPMKIESARATHESYVPMPPPPPCPGDTTDLMPPPPGWANHQTFLSNDAGMALCIGIIIFAAYRFFIKHRGKK